MRGSGCREGCMEEVAGGNDRGGQDSICRVIQGEGRSEVKGFNPVRVQVTL